MDKTGRNGLRVGDIQDPDFLKKYNQLKQKHIDLLRLYNFTYNIEEQEKDWFEGIEEIRRYKIIDSEYEVNHLLSLGKKVLAEGAQGTMLDIDFGSYPFVTSSNTISAGACTGLGLAPSRIGEVFGVFKAYCTRVGSGPFPTELNDETGNLMREKGHEYGATTGRPRRCGWLDLVALKYSILINGATQLYMTKADVLAGFDIIKVCTGYKINGRITEKLPYELYDVDSAEYVEFKGWGDVSMIDHKDDIPATLQKYIDFIEKETGIPVTLVSLGPDRKQILFR
jgi:adenylosuccinate synthase